MFKYSRGVALEHWWHENSSLRTTKVGNQQRCWSYTFTNTEVVHLHAHEVFGDAYFHLRTNANFMMDFDYNIILHAGLVLFIIIEMYLSFVQHQFCRIM